MLPAGISCGAISPGITSSSPVENSATLGRRTTGKVAKPILAAKPSDAGFNRSPCRSTTAPTATSSPARRIHWPDLGTELT